MSTVDFITGPMSLLRGTQVKQSIPRSHFCITDTHNVYNPPIYLCCSFSATDAEVHLQVVMSRSVACGTIASRGQHATHLSEKTPKSVFHYTKRSCRPCTQGNRQHEPCVVQDCTRSSVTHLSSVQGFATTLWLQCTCHVIPYYTT